MGWAGPGEHEGYVAKVFRDGLTGAGESSTGIIVWPLWQTHRSSELEEIRPYDEVVAWRFECACGWEGDLYPLAHEHPADIDTRWAEPTEDREMVLKQPWNDHIEPFYAIEELADLAERWHEIDQAVTAAVHRARDAGASWSLIGRELGLTKQGAQQRYGAHVAV